jgi:hypothetical protein
MILFQDEIKKTPPNYNAAMRRLRIFLNRQEPRLATFLYHTWNNQQDAITYRELRQAILNGGLSEATIEEWRQDYTRMVNVNIKPMWLQAINEAAKQLEDKYPEYLYDPHGENTRRWTATRSAELIRDLTDNQRDAINGVIQYAANVEVYSVDQLAQIIRPMVGLYQQQAMANYRYLNAVRNGLIEAHPRITRESALKQAQEAALKYAARQNRYRANMIARTELAFAYNHGELGAVKQAISERKMGRTEKASLTAGDDRVCWICRAMNLQYIPIDDMFILPTGKEVEAPPFHPHCRDVVIYREAEAPSF